MTRAMFLAWVALPALVPTNAAAQSAAGVPAAPTPEIAADLPKTPVEVSAVKENGLFRLRTTEISLALYTYDQDAEDRSACVGTCAQNWPPVLAPTGAHRVAPRRSAAMGLQGPPAYIYARDKPNGGELGQGQGGVWHLMKF